jgi:hypothetical protein
MSEDQARTTVDAAPDTLDGPAGDGPVENRWTSLLADVRVAPLAALVGVVAILLSLLSEWQVTVLDGPVFQDDELGSRPIAASIGTLGSWGAAYLVAVLALVVALSLTVFGPRPGRGYARIVALAAGGTLLAVLAGIAADLRELSFALHPSFTINVDPEQYTLASGRGVYCGFVGTAALLLAAWLAVPAPAPETARTTSSAAAVAGDESAAGEWLWRRPDRPDDEEQPEAPIGLTVNRSTPFQPAPNERDAAG